jgi:exopolyphosphatase / guanosine-5'-triphosphate,3'-diphosphate pyrophosphatase
LRVAAIDLGTNTTRLLVADVAEGRVGEVLRRTAITRLGEGVDRRRRLLPTPIARVRNVLTDYRREVEALGAERALLVATSAVRDAENGEAFLGEIEWSYGFATRLLSGAEEALMTFRGVSTGRPLAGETLVLDVGGGSTELIGGSGDAISFSESLDIGSVRLAERFLPSDPPPPNELVECAASVRELLSERLPVDLHPTALVGVAGTITSVAALDLGLEEYDRTRVDGSVLTLESVDCQIARLAALTLEERRQVPALEPERAPMIIPGAIITREVLHHFGLDGLQVSERDILDGAALAAAELPVTGEGEAPPGAYTCC